MRNGKYEYVHYLEHPRVVEQKVNNKFFIYLLLWIAGALDQRIEIIPSAWTGEGDWVGNRRKSFTLASHRWPSRDSRVWRLIQRI